MAPPSIFENMYPCIALREPGKELDASFFTSPLASLQTIFDINCINGEISSKYSLMTNFITVFATMMGANFYDGQSDYEYLSTFCKPLKHYREMTQCFSEYANDMSYVHKEALSFATKIREKHNLSKEVVEEATRTMCLSGITFISALANGTSYSTHTILSNVCSAPQRRKQFHLAFGEIASFVKRNTKEAIHRLTTILLLGRRCIQDSTEMNLAMNEHSNCCSCGSKVNCFHLQTGLCKACPKCKQLMCENCNECHCSILSTNIKTMQDKVTQWFELEELKREKQQASDELLQIMKQNETLCKKNVEMGLEDKKLKYTIEVLQTQQKHHKIDLKKMKQDNAKDLAKLEALNSKLRQESFSNQTRLSELEVELEVHSQVMSTSLLNQDEALMNLFEELRITLKKESTKEQRNQEKHYKSRMKTLHSNLEDLQEKNLFLMEDNEQLKAKVNMLTKELKTTKETMQVSLSENESIIQKLSEKPQMKSVATWTIKQCSEAATNTESTETKEESKETKKANTEKTLNDRILQLEKCMQDQMQNQQMQNVQSRQVVGYPVNSYPPQPPFIYPPTPNHHQQYMYMPPPMMY